MKSRHPYWWKGAVIYQIYPRSFFDTSGDGIGDLPGILRKMDYIASLNVDAVWICPFFKSPMADFGYDISDYREVDPVFGSMDDFHEIVEAAHERGMGAIIDMVINHTSNRHIWFRESRRNKHNPKADWYIWRDPKPDGTPPNNWLSRFGGPAWTFEPRRRQYYLHGFLECQPDLNFRNPEVQNRMLEEIEYWLKHDVDGIRLDACNHYFKDDRFRDNPVREHPEGKSYEEPYIMQQHVYDRTRPENVEFLGRIREVMDRYPGTFALGEVGDDREIEVSADYAGGNDRLHTTYCFSMMRAENFEPDTFRKPVEEFNETTHEAWPTWAFSNHDSIRPATRFGGAHAGNPAFIKMMLALQLSLRGTQLVYQGQELGLPDADIPYARMLDPWGKRLYPIWKGRDGTRTPMPWAEEPVTGGFTSAPEPWLPVPDEHIEISVEVQEEREDSPLAFTRRLIAWRREIPPLLTGHIKFHDCPYPFLALSRNTDDGREFHAAFNLSPEKAELPQDVLPRCDCDPLVPQSQRPDLKNGSYHFPAFGFFFAPAGKGV